MSKFSRKCRWPICRILPIDSENAPSAAGYRQVSKKCRSLFQEFFKLSGQMNLMTPSKTQVVKPHSSVVNGNLVHLLMRGSVLEILEHLQLKLTRHRTAPPPNHTKVSYGFGWPYGGAGGSTRLGSALACQYERCFWKTGWAQWPCQGLRTSTDRKVNAEYATICLRVLPIVVVVSCSPSLETEFTPAPLYEEASASNEQIRVLSSSSQPKSHAVAPYLEFGTGEFVARTNEKSEAKALSADGNEFSINLVDAEISEVIDQILGDQLNLNYVIDPRIDGQITIRTNSGLPANDVLSILDSVLNLNGAALVEDDGLYRVMPIDQVIGAGVKPAVHPVANINRVGFGVEIVPVRFVEVDNLIEILQPLLSSESTIRINGQRNTILLIGPRDELKTLVETIKIFDVDWMKGMSFGLFNLEYANALELVRELGEIFRGFDNSGANKSVKFVPIRRLNAVVAVASQPDYLNQIKTWIQKLDQPADDNEERIFFYSVQNGRASEIAKILSRIFEIENSVVRSDKISDHDPIVTPLMNPIEFATSNDTSDDGLAEFDRLAFELEHEAYDQQFVDRISFDNRRREAVIVADEVNNALIIKTTPANFRKIDESIRKIDVQPVQVLLEATIAEVTLKDELDYGIQWFFRFGTNNFTLSESPSGSVDQLFPGFSGLFPSSNIRAVFSALDSVSDVRIISSPQILVLDNQTAQLEVGDEVPVITQQSQSTDSDSDRLLNTIEQRQTGVILNVTPRVNASGLVILDIQQEVSDVVQTTTSGIDSPTISQRRIGTSIAVGNYQTVALGGLIRDRTDQAKQGVPLLSRVPVFGSLFGGTSERIARTELLVLITPKVIRNYGEAQKVTEELRRRFRSLSPLERKLNRATLLPEAG